MKFKKEYAILTVVMIALILYLVMHSSDRTYYDLPLLPEIEADDISKIEVVKPELSYQLLHKDDQWLIEPGSFPADDTRTTDMLHVIQNLNITALVSESGNYSRYELDDARQIRVKAWAGDTLKREFIIGKPATTCRHTHILVGDHRGVYHAEGNFRSDFDLDIDELRDKGVLHFEKDTIREIHITREQENILITKTKKQPDESLSDGKSSESKDSSVPTEMQTMWQTPSGKTVKVDEVNSLLSSLSHLKCESYLENRRKEDLQEPLMTLKLTAGEQFYTLSVFKQDDDTAASGFPGISSQNDDVFRLAEYQVENIKKTIAKMLPDTE